MDEDGYIWIIGRIDDVIKVSGYRLGTAEIQKAPCQPCGCYRSGSHCTASRFKGNAIHTFAILRTGVDKA